MDVFFSDFDSFSESSSSEDQEDNEFMYGGQARSILSSLEETIGKIDDFLLFERGYAHGDVVCAIADPSGQIGKVINVDMVVDLESIYGKKIKDVSSKKLRKIHSISVGDYVVVGPWVGKVEKIIPNATVLFDDGTKCEFTASSQERLIPLSPDLVDDSQYPYYPGQRVQVELSSMSKSARWFFCGAQKEKQEGTVFTVDAGLVYVNWLGCALFGSERMEAPPSLQNFKDLISLSSFSHSSWQLGDWCTLTKTNNANFQEIFVIAKTKTKVDILWQDGSQSSGLDSNSLFPVNIVDAHDFWPEQFVMEKATLDDPNVQKWGVVKFVDAKEKTVRVRWDTSELKQEQDLDHKQLEETVSAYELVEHPDYSYCQGDVVFKLQNRKDLSKEEKPKNFHLSEIGIVVGFKDAIVEVKWAAGFTTKVAPHEIFRMDKSESLSAIPLLHDENSEPNEEKSENNDQSLALKEKDMLDFDGDGNDNDCLKNLRDSSSFLVPQAAIRVFTSLAAHLFGAADYSSFSHTSDHDLEDEPRSGIHEEEVMNPTMELTSGIKALADTKMEGKIKESEDYKDIPFSSAEKSVKQKQFDIVNNCSNHHFVDGAGKGLASCQVKRGWLKKVQQDWSILEKGLPESIYVRVYEERMDLLHAAIVGTPGTPYHDGLFFFDIFLPPEYPNEPPMVHYHSGGLRVNPNLYESGKVCLSLLNTWMGTGTETWNPKDSTILQVLLSLQALVLNEKPYFNEAGYDRQLGSIEGQKNSVSYNENAFLVSCKSQLYILRKPPKHFEALVDEHFKERGKFILIACKAYLEGVPIGCAFGKETTDEEVHKKSSTGFKIMLSKLFPKLVEAFSDKGIDCSEYIENGK